MTSFPQTILMCRPDHFEVVYVINPWMEGQFANTDDAVAHRQWNDLRNAIEQHAKLVLEPPQQDLPGIVFTANAGIVLGKKVTVSRFRSRERQGEEPHHRALVREKWI
jgi:N-dimethylarginine dimethylaminohydrolase